jgi:predicted porin
MNKKLIALAIAGATIAPAALAQSANPVTLYGTLNIDFENVKAAGAAGAGVNALSRNRVSANSSNFGFRGTEDLGGGLKAFFQLEMGSVAIDVGGGNLAGRNSAVGLQGSAGTVLLGNWDTPYKSSTGSADAFYGTGIANHVNVTAGNATPPATHRLALRRRQRVLPSLGRRFAVDATAARPLHRDAHGVSPPSITV